MTDSDTPTAHTSAASQLNVNVNNYSPPTFSVNTLPNGTIGQSYNQGVSIQGGHAPFTIVTERVPGGIATLANGSQTNETGTPVEASSVNFVGIPTQLSNHFSGHARGARLKQSGTTGFDHLLCRCSTGRKSAHGNRSRCLATGAAMASDQLGVNIVSFFESSGDPTYVPLWASAGVQLMRYPGGNGADYYHWETNTWGCGFASSNPNFAFDTWGCQQS